MSLPGPSPAWEAGPRELRRLLESGTHPVPGVFNAAVAMMAERAGFAALYVSGAATANGVAGFPDVGLLSLEEVARHVRYTAGAVSLPVIVDADTGFGGPINVVRAVRELEWAGAAGIHLEDQENPKRCGHLLGKRVVPVEEMVRKIAAAAAARRGELVLIARTDARSVEGFEAALERGSRYVEAGADALFPEGLESAEEFAAFAQAARVPLVANMTEFGRTPYLSVEQFAALGCRLVLFPLTAFRAAMRAAGEALAELAAAGSQQGFLDRMQTRRELYDLLRYDEYARLDEEIAGFE